MTSPNIMKPTKITIHCSASKNGVTWAAHDIRDEHMKSRGFSDIGYHGVIQPSGLWEEGRPLNVVGAHVEGHNTGNIGICLIGTDKFTINQFDVLRYKLSAIQMTYSIPKHNIFCHSQFDTAIKQGKCCPNIPINVILLWYYNVVGDEVLSPYLLK